MVQAKKVEELESNLANLAKELEVARSEVASANINAKPPSSRPRAWLIIRSGRLEGMLSRRPLLKVSTYMLNSRSPKLMKQRLKS